MLSETRLHKKIMLSRNWLDMDHFPILDVHSKSVVAVWPSIKYGIDTAQFVALDLVSGSFI